jgi:hypothetical protein
MELAKNCCSVRCEALEVQVFRATEDNDSTHMLLKTQRLEEQVELVDDDSYVFAARLSDVKEER